MKLNRHTTAYWKAFFSTKGTRKTKHEVHVEIGKEEIVNWSPATTIISTLNKDDASESDFFAAAVC